MEIDSDSGRVSLDYRKASPESIVILAHGYLSNKGSRTNTELSKRLNESSISTISFDMYGHGESEGDVELLTVSKVVDNALAVIDFAEREGFGSIGLAGSSFSGAVSVICAAKRELAALALKCPVFDGKKLWDERLGKEGVSKWKEQKFMAPFGRRWSFEIYEDESSYDMGSIASEVKAPTLVIHGDRDRTVPISQAEELFGSLRCEKKFVVVEGADHFFNEKEHFERMISESHSWFLKYLV